MRVLVVAVDHARHAAGATRRPGGPLAGLSDAPSRFSSLTVAILNPHLSQWKRRHFPPPANAASLQDAGAANGAGL